MKELPKWSHRRTLRGYAIGKTWRNDAFHIFYTVYGRTLEDARRAAIIMTNNLNARKRRNKMRVIPMEKRKA